MSQEQVSALMDIRLNKQALMPPAPHLRNPQALTRWHYALFSNGKAPMYFQSHLGARISEVLVAVNFEAAWHKHTHFAIWYGEHRAHEVPGGTLLGVFPVLNVLGQPIATHGGAA